MLTTDDSTKQKGLYVIAFDILLNCAGKENFDCTTHFFDSLNKERVTKDRVNVLKTFNIMSF